MQQFTSRVLDDFTHGHLFLFPYYLSKATSSEPPPTPPTAKPIRVLHKEEWY